MLDLVSSGFLSLWFNQAEVVSLDLPLRPAAIETTLVQVASPPTDGDAEAILESYLGDLSERGFSSSIQGIWLQSDYQILGNQNGFTPRPAASLTKVATSLVSLKQWGPEHQFQTLIGTTGIIQGGVLAGDLVVQGGGDPLFVWEKAFELGNALNQLGVRQVTGDLVIVGDFAMNFQRDPQEAGALLKQALDASQWPTEAAYYFQSFPLGTLKPRLQISGTVRVAERNPVNQRILLRHDSLTLIQLLKQMNIYSNNDMAEMFAKGLGGGPVVAERAAWYAGVPTEEIQLINGSGLGQENQISPRAAGALFRAIQDELHYWSSAGGGGSYTIADLFPVSGLDQGTIKDRNIPATAVVKTGTLWDVSALAGVLPTRDRGLMWFAIINGGDGVDTFRRQQDQLLQTLTQNLGVPLSPPLAVAPTLYNAAPKSGQDLSERP